MKKIVLSSLVGLFVLSCSLPVANNSSLVRDTSSPSPQTPLLGGAGVGSLHPSLIKYNFAELEKEYKYFSTKALSDAYVKRMFGKYLDETPNSTQLYRQLEFSRYLKNNSDSVYETSLKNMFAETPLLYNQMTAITEINQKMTSDSANFGTYVESLSPYVSVPIATSATNITTTSFTANWNTSNAATGYKLFVDNNEVYSGINKSFNISGLSINTTHNYYVKAINALGESANSNTVSVTLLPSVPLAPIATGAGNITNISFTANWSSVTGATGYKLFVNGNNLYSGSNTSFNITGLTGNTTYNYYVKAINAVGESINSNTVSVLTIPSPPASPVATAATNITQASFQANWNASSNADSYELYVNGNNVYSGTNTYYNFTGLTGETVYSYFVIAVNNQGDSTASNAISVTTKPAPPVANSATGVNSGGFTANWTSVSSATGYILKYTDGTTTYTTSTLSSSTFSKAVSGLIPSTQYSYYVYALTPYGNTANSNTVYVNTSANSTNYALSATKSPSGTASGSSVARVADGDTATTWNAGASEPQWVRFDFGQARYVSLVWIMTGSSPAGNCFYRVQGSNDGSSFTTIANGVAYTATWSSASFSAVSYRYIRIYAYDWPSTSWIAIKEVEIY